MDDATLSTAVHDLAETLQREANVRAVFGDPISLGAKSIIPVAVVSMGGGGGAGHGPTLVGPDTAGAGALGLGVTVVPIGFIHEEDGKIVYTSIHGARDAMGQSHPAATSVDVGHLGARVLAALQRRRTS